MSTPLPNPDPLPRDGTALEVLFVRSELHAVEAGRDRPTGVFVDAAGSLFLSVNGRGHAIRFGCPDDPLRLALVLLAVADRIAGDHAAVAAKVDERLRDLVAARGVAGNA